MQPSAQQALPADRFARCARFAAAEARAVSPLQDSPELEVANMSRDHPIVVLLGLVSTIISIIVGSISIYQFITGNTSLSLSSVSLPELSLPMFSIESSGFPNKPIDWLIMMGKILFWIGIAVLIVAYCEVILGLLKLVLFFVGLFVLLPTAMGLTITSIFTYFGYLLGVPEVGLALGLFLVVSFLIYFVVILIRGPSYSI